MPDPVYGLHHPLSPFTQLYKNPQQNAATTVTGIITLASAMSCGFIRDRTHANICSSRSISALNLKETSSDETINQNKVFPRLNSLQNSLKASCHPWTTLCLLTKHSACLPSGEYCTSSIMHKLTNHKDLQQPELPVPGHFNHGVMKTSWVFVFLSLCCFVLTASFSIQQDTGYLPTSGRLTTQIPLDESQEYNLLKIASWKAVACLCAVLENVTFKSTMLKCCVTYYTSNVTVCYIIKVYWHAH